MLVIEAVRKDDLIVNEEDKSDGEALPNDDDTVNADNEYELWKIRELKRIKRDKEDLVAKEKQRKEIERRRRMTDAQREEENKRLGADSIKTEKTAMKFMQKYYHKGAYYQDTNDPLFQRDYNVAVGSDNFEKANLPGILQKRGNDFGKKGASKWTHLSAEDTSNFDPMWRGDDIIKDKLIAKQAGYKGVGALDRPSLKKK
jgi:microfibrillar-associated protein 1